MEERKHIVILAAGDFPTHPIPLHTLREADYVVCCDSAYNDWKKASEKWQVKIPFTVIGDGDSISPSDKNTLGNNWIEVAEQDYNDLHKAVHWVMKEIGAGAEISILGATGKREDHTIGNISYLATFGDEYPGIPIEILTDHGRFTLAKGAGTFCSFPGQQVSLISLTPHIPVSATGLRWPLDNRHLSIWWQGTLNEALSYIFTVEGGSVLVFQTYEPKE